MSQLLTLVYETFTLLRRDRIFIPAVILGSITIFIAHLASLWGIEEYHKLLYDIGTFGFHITGAVVAILWGTKMISDSRQDGSLDVQLASPISRTTWIVGKFLGLVLALLVLGGVLSIVWQFLIMSHGLPGFEKESLLIMSTLILGWIVIAALSVFFAAISSQAIALFSAVCMWIAGLVSSPIANVLSPETPASTRALVESIARYWNLSRFNLGEYSYSPSFPATSELVWIGVYGFSLAATLLVLSAISFSRKDLA